MASSERPPPQHQGAQRAPEPAQPDQTEWSRAGCPSRTHPCRLHSAEGEQAAGHDQRGKDPVQRAAALMKLSFRVMVAVFMGWINLVLSMSNSGRVHGLAVAGQGHHGRVPAPLGRQPHPQAALAHVEHRKNPQDQQGTAQVNNVGPGARATWNTLACTWVKSLSWNAMGAGYSGDRTAPAPPAS
jgi:hypothetical protein